MGAAFLSLSPAVGFHIPAAVRGKPCPVIRDTPVHSPAAYGPLRGVEKVHVTQMPVVDG